MAFRRTSQPATPLAQLVAEALRDRKTLARQLVIGSVLSEPPPARQPRPRLRAYRGFDDRMQPDESGET